MLHVSLSLCLVVCPGIFAEATSIPAGHFAVTGLAREIEDVRCLSYLSDEAVLTASFAILQLLAQPTHCENGDLWTSTVVNGNIENMCIASGGLRMHPLNLQVITVIGSKWGV